MENRINITSGHARPTCPDFVQISNESWQKNCRSQCEWSVRLRNEYERSKMCVFVTLTFDDAHLPLLNYSPSYRWDTPCFDGERVSEQLIRPLRQVHLYQFKYIFFPEYGKDDDYIDDYGRLRKGTNRPHYHGLLFFDYDVDIDILTECIYSCWKSCIRKCLKVLLVSSDKGFTRYVSKYVSKGIETKHFPVDCLTHVKRCREIVRDARLTPVVSDSEKYRLEHAVHFLHWYETHRPKLLCSRGIGMRDYTPDELKNGSIQMFNGREYVRTPIPSYNKRKAYYDIGIDTNYRYMRIHDGLVDYVPDGEMYNLQTWSLNDKGRECLSYQIGVRVEDFRNMVSLVHNLHGPISYDNIQRLNDSLSSEYGPIPDGYTYDDMLINVNELESAIGSDFFEYACAYKFLLSRYTIDRFYDITGIQVTAENLSSIVHNWRALYDFILQMDSFYYHYGSNRKKGSSFSSFEKLSYVSTLVDFYNSMYTMLRYDDHIKAMTDYTMQKEHNKIRFRGK